jgi:hypothetical protein
MRIAVLILAILGALASAALGIKWLSDANEYKATLEAVAKMGIDTSEITSLIRGAYALLGGAVLALVGGFLAMNHKGKIAAGVLALAVIAPAAMAPKTLVATFFLVIAAILAIFVKPKTA